MLAHEIHFCVHEAILNVIQHTYRWDLDQPLDIRSRSGCQHDRVAQAHHDRSVGLLGHLPRLDRQGVLAKGHLHSFHIV